MEADAQAAAFKVYKYIQSCGTTRINQAGYQSQAIWRSEVDAQVSVAKTGTPDERMSFFLGDIREL